MHFLAPKKRQKKYKIRSRGLVLDFNQQLMLHRKLDRLQDQIPEDSKIEFNILKAQIYEAQLKVKGSLFGCDLQSESPNIDGLINTIIRNVETEVQQWKESPEHFNNFAPYFGGYPAYYKEQTI